MYIQGNDGVYDLIHYYICMQKEKLHSTCIYILTCMHIGHEEMHGIYTYTHYAHSIFVDKYGIFVTP